jgi:hypothetical protein
MFIRSLRFKSVLAGAVSLAIGGAMVACGSDSNGGGSPEAGTGGSGGSEPGTGGKGAGGSGGKGSGGVGNGGTGTGGTGTGGAGSGGKGAGGTGGKGTGGTGGTGGTDAGTDGGDAGDGCVATESLTPPTVPDLIKVPAGATLLHHFHAVGTQNYTCTATPPTEDGGATTYAYGAAATPDAILSDSCNHPVIHHSGGPTWTWLADSSAIVAVRLQGVAVTGSIPQLLLQVNQHTGSGVLSPVTYVQRLDTTGGVMPTAGCGAANVGSIARVAYEANYYFYEGPPKSNDGGADAADGHD